MKRDESVTEQINNLVNRMADFEEKIAALTDERDKLKHERDEYKKLYELVLLELERTRRHLFGKKSERIDPAQTQLAFEPIVKSSVLDPDHVSDKSIDEENDPERNRKKGRKHTPHGRQKLPEHLPVEIIELLPPELQGADAEQYERIGDEKSSETIEWRTGSFVRVQVIRPKYVKKGDPHQGVHIAPPAERPIPKGMGGPGMLAQVLVSKYDDHQPLQRQSRIYLRQGVHLARSTLCNWVEGCYELCHLVVDAMFKDAIDNASYIAVDATGVLVLAKNKCRRGHFWVLISENGHILYRYTHKHNQQVVKDLLCGYSGYVQADAATVFDFLFRADTCIEVGCWAHCRRRFFDAISTDKNRALIAIGFIGELYKIDRETAKLQPKYRTEMRASRSGPVLEKFYQWIDVESFQVLPESPIGKAITYARNQREALSRFLEDGRLRLDNNFSERELRREAVGRRNWMFVGSDDGAHWNTTFVSLIASCQFHRIEPWAYLRDLLCLLPSWPANRVLELAPKFWSQTLEQPETQQLLAANVFRQIHFRNS